VLQGKHGKMACLRANRPSRMIRFHLHLLCSQVLLAASVVFGLVNSVACKCALNVTSLGKLESKMYCILTQYTHVKVLILLLYHQSNRSVIRSQASPRSSTHQQIKEHTGLDSKRILPLHIEQQLWKNFQLYIALIYLSNFHAKRNASSHHSSVVLTVCLWVFGP